MQSKTVFETTEENEENSMKWILQKFDFNKTGKTFIGSKTNKNIELYLLTRTNGKIPTIKSLLNLTP